MPQKHRNKNNTQKPQGGFKKATPINGSLNEKTIKQKKLDSRLFHAVENEKWNEAKELIVKGADVNVTDLENNTILLMAIEKKAIGFVEFLLEQKNIDVNIRSFNFRKTPLILSIEKHLRNITTKLIRKGADVNEGNDEIHNTGQTPLMYAYEYGESDLVKVLLSHPKIDINKKTEDGKTALMYACKSGSKEQVKQLLKKGANVNDKDIYGMTPLIHAARHANHEIIQLLIDYGAKSNEKDKVGNTAFLSINKIYKGCSNSYYETAKILFSNKADINTQDNSGQTPLMAALKNNKVQLVNFLLDNGADAKLVDKLSKTTLMYAIDGENKELIELILKRVDINFSNKSRTALMYACDKKSSASTIQLLLDNGADVNVYVGNNAFNIIMYNKHIIYDKKYYPIFKIFIEKSNIVSSSFIEESLNYLGDSCDYSHQDYSELFNLLKLAINKGVDVNTIHEKSKRNFLMIAAANNNLEFTKFLIDKGININATDKDKKTALHYSTSIKINDLLIQNGVKVHSIFYYLNKVGLKTIFKKLFN
jgi:ankyrin repeat protein